MSRHEIEIEGLPEGWEPVKIARPTQGDKICDELGRIIEAKYCYGAGDGVRLIVRRKVRKYDWGKTHSGTLVTRVDQDGYWTCGISFALGKQACIADLWQPNIHGKCPVDGEACWVRVRLVDGTQEEIQANKISWSLNYGDIGDIVVAWQFIRLADGYEW